MALACHVMKDFVEELGKDPGCMIECVGRQLNTKQRSTTARKAPIPTRGGQSFEFLSPKWSTS
jgi:hypothetical protein